MTDTAATTTSSPPPNTPTTPTWTRWLNPILAITGIALGVFIIGAVLYLLFVQPGGCHSMMKADPPPATQSKDCCASMKDMKMPMGNMPSMSPMPGMPSTPNMPSPAPTR